MDEEIKKIYEEIEGACEEYLSQYSEGDPPEHADAALTPILASMAKLVNASPLVKIMPAATNHCLEAASAVVQSKDGQAMAYVLVDKYRKLVLVMKSLCPEHGDDCPEAMVTPPRNVTLRELRLIGFTSVGIVKSIQGHIGSVLLEDIAKMATMPRGIA